MPRRSPPLHPASTPSEKEDALPLLNGGEAMAVYSFVFLYLAAAGAGPLSVDAAMKRA